ncbi:MAG: dihydropteroate synthase [Proteobacteria bacterium]|nr:dihydropteroate synthase [Pseudomonadota bacterium]
MSNVLLALGSNLGDRMLNLERAVTMLAHDEKITLHKVSSVYETPALLTQDAPANWNLPFCNLAMTIETPLDPISLLDQMQFIERHIGREPSAKWSPRLIDIDMIAFDNLTIESARLTVPHPHAMRRSFVLAPAVEIDPDRILPGQSATLLEMKRKLICQLPAWMRIINVTADSFSGDGMLGNAIDQPTGANYIDVGAESTRPGAASVDPEEEWRRLEPVLEQLDLTRLLRPRVSIDTRNVATANRALQLGVDVINDVSGLGREMLELLSGSMCDVVLMHSLTVPVQRDTVLPADMDPVAAIRQWFQDRMSELVSRGIDSSRIILDPGIGFGKTAAQSLQLIGRAREFTDLGCRVLYGHSRKSFLHLASPLPAAERDIETLAMSVHLADQGVDVLRVHAHDLHRRFWNTRALAESQF